MKTVQTVASVLALRPYAPVRAQCPTMVAQPLGRDPVSINSKEKLQWPVEVPQQKKHSVFKQFTAYSLMENHALR